MKLTSNEVLTAEDGLSALLGVEVSDVDLSVDLAVLFAEINAEANKIRQALDKLREQCGEDRDALAAKAEALGNREVSLEGVQKISLARLREAVSGPIKPLVWVRLRPITKE
ncbi:MAG TPA: hypothetical protein VF212_15360 [Longimicrobiales bacterium]